MSLAERPATRAVFRSGVLEIRFGSSEALPLTAGKE